MGPLDAFWHVAGFLAVPLLLAGLASASAKLLWRGELVSLPWRSLFGWATAGTVGPAVAGLLAFGRDGRMLTYGAMVLGCALMLWWRGFGPGRRAAR